MSEAVVTNRGFGRLLVAVYAVFALSACGRSVTQLATKFDQAPVPYLLSAFAAAVYVVATVALAKDGPGWWRIALVACSVELVGVVGIGAVSAAVPEWFDEATVWSEFGAGYGFVPLVLPFVGLWWLWRTRPALTRRPG
ncbi:hypothetical protein [Nocardioides massiliensis]|uniref:Integral membrane protein n=1 Tax=Nocardioides massiliensis TaxID=1325935 RepID=A0ABT9NIR3_9ACTN|nr:hypothetical protein [Nocardioides massiliensis]MDP9820298.1 hypothetical protein [Nocardioides massiliensis]